MRFACVLLWLLLLFFQEGRAQNVDSLKALFSQEEDFLKKVDHALKIADAFDGSVIKVDSIQSYLPLFEDFVKQYPKSDLALEARYYLGASHYYSNPDLMFTKLDEITNEAAVRNDTAVYVKSLYLRAAKMRVLSMPNEAIALLKKGVRFMEGSSSHSAQFYKNKFATLMGTNYILLGNYEIALKHALTAQKTAIQLDDDRLLLRAYFKLSAIYGNLSSEEKQLVSKVERERYKVLAEDVMIKAFEHCKNMPVSRSTGISAYNLGVFYSIDSQFVKSKIYLDEAMRIGRVLPYEELLFNVYDVLAADFLTANQLDSAEVYIDRSEALAEKMNYPFHQISAGGNRSRLLWLQKRPQQAREVALKFLEMAKDKELKDKERALYELLYLIEEDTGNFQRALEYYKKKVALATEIAGVENIEKIEQLRAQYNHERQQSEIEKLEKEKAQQALRLSNKNRWIAIAVLLGVLMSLMIYYRNREKISKAREKTLEAQQKLLRMQLNPHFLFNTLNSIQQFIYLKEEPRTVADYLSKFSHLMRQILQNSQKDLIELRTEIDFLKDYLDLQKLRFDTPFRYEIEVDDDLDVDDVLIPPMFTQPFVENSIEHGNLDKISQGTVKIQFAKKSNGLEIVIEDNGVGIDKTQFKLRNEKHRSLATKITYERIQNMMPVMKKNTHLEILDLSSIDEQITGTQVRLNFPLIYD